MTTLFRIACGLRYFGVGCKFVRENIDKPDTYWLVTRVYPSKDQSSGVAFGRLVWKGQPEERIRKIGPARKKGWRLVSLPDYKSFHGDCSELEGRLNFTETATAQLSNI